MVRLQHVRFSFLMVGFGFSSPIKMAGCINGERKSLKGFRTGRHQGSHRVEEPGGVWLGPTGRSDPSGEVPVRALVSWRTLAALDANLARPSVKGESGSAVAGATVMSRDRAEAGSPREGASRYAKERPPMWMSVDSPPEWSVPAAHLSVSIGTSGASVADIDLFAARCVETGLSPVGPPFTWSAHEAALEDFGHDDGEVSSDLGSEGLYIH
jgi:hypothetical protein